MIGCLCSYRLAQAAVREGIPKLHILNIDTKRPNDYLAEMAKSDTHMQKVNRIIFAIQTDRPLCDYKCTMNG